MRPDEEQTSGLLVVSSGRRVRVRKERVSRAKGALYQLHFYWWSGNKVGPAPANFRGRTRKLNLSPDAAGEVNGHRRRQNLRRY